MKKISNTMDSGEKKNSEVHMNLCLCTRKCEKGDKKWGSLGVM